MKISPSRGLKIILVTVIVGGALLVLNIPVVNGAFKNTVYLALSPLQRNVWVAGASTRSFFDNLSKMRVAASENERLKRQINDLMAQVSEIEAVRKENEFLRQGLNLELNKDFDLKLANIIAKDVSQDIIIIDQGANDLVQEGMPVITSQRAVVGRVSKTYSGYSEVTLVTAKNFSFDVKIGDEEIDGLVKGGGSNNAIVDLVSKEKQLKEGVLVSTSQLGGIFPGGLLVGTVSKVNNSDVDTFQSAVLVPSFDVDKSLQVFVASGKLSFGLGGAEALKNNE